MGSVLLTMIVKTGISLDPGETGMNPERIPATLGRDRLIGSQGLSNVDCTTEWFCGRSASRMSEAAATGYTYSWVKLELHHLAHADIQVVRVELQATVHIPDLHNMHVDH